MTSPSKGAAMPNGGKVHLKTFGCQMNEYDSNRMLDILRERLGMTPTDNVNEADLILLNTCSIREKAEDKVYSYLGRYGEMKAERPALLLGVGGCVASQEGETILARAPYVDLVFGPQTLHRLPEMINAVRQSGRAQCDISFPENDKFDALPAPKVEHATAYVSIMEGCSKYCSFCVVPYTRGEEISRPLPDVMAEIREIAAQGVKEITLLGQNVNAYAGPRADGEMVDFAYLLEQVELMDGIERIRFTTSHPLEMTDRLIATIGKLKKIVNYLHLPVQSGSDRVLMAMKRGYTRLEYKSIIRKIKSVRPDIALSSDFIVGFPGETEADFQDTLKLIDECGFDQSFSFIYSRRPGTPAAGLVDELSDAEKHSRLERLQELLDRQALARSEAMVGKVVKIMVERTAKRNADEVAGRTECNRWVNFAAPISLIGQLVDVKITAAHPYSLRGEWLSSTQETSPQSLHQQTLHGQAGTVVA